MKQSCCGKLGMTTAALLLLASSAIRADDGTTLVLREPGKVERCCHIERSTPQPNGDTIYDLRDLATGERFQVVDTRVIKTGGPLIIQASLNMPSRRDAAMIAALAASPFIQTPDGRRIPTLSEQAPRGGPSISNPGLFRALDK